MYFIREEIHYVYNRERQYGKNLRKKLLKNFPKILTR